MDMMSTGMTWECEMEVLVRTTKSLDPTIICTLPRLSTVLQSGEEVTVRCGTGTVLRMPVLVLRRFDPPIRGWITSDARGAGGPVLVALG